MPSWPKLELRFSSAREATSDGSVLVGTVTRPADGWSSRNLAYKAMFGGGAAGTMLRVSGSIELCSARGLTKTALGDRCAEAGPVLSRPARDK